MQIQLKDLIDFCFQQLPAAKQKEVAIKVLTDAETFQIIRGINLLKKEHGDKQAVEAYLNACTEQVRQEFFHKHFQKQVENDPAG